MSPGRLPRLLAALAAACLVGGLTGCLAVGPDYHPPDMEAPPAYVQPGQAEERHAPDAGAEAVAWWRAFDDPVLNELVSDALAANPDLAQARARLRQSRADVAIARAALFPAVDVTGSATASDNGLINAGTGTTTVSSTGTGLGAGSGMTGGSVSGGTSQTGTATTEDAASGASTTTLFSAGFDASWEIDIFGGLRREREAATATAQASLWDLEATRLTLLAEVATAYMELRAAQEQEDIARRNLDCQRQTVEVTRERFRLGLTSRLDVAQAEGQAASTSADLPRRKAEVARAVHRLGVLTGRQPQALYDLLSPPRPQPEVGRVALAAGLPADLLARRPDLRRAERELAAASAAIGAATADLYPKFDLTAGLGLQGVTPSNVAGFSTWYWSAIPGVSWPLFDAGKARAAVEKKRAAYEEALAAYRQAFHTALEDVENALADYAAASERRARLADAVAAYQEAKSLAELRYTRGLTGILDVLTVDAALYAAQTELSEAESALRTGLIALYKALGGGWKAATEHARNDPGKTGRHIDIGVGMPGERGTALRDDVESRHIRSVKRMSGERGTALRDDVEKGVRDACGEESEGRVRDASRGGLLSCLAGNAVPFSPQVVL